MCDVVAAVVTRCPHSRGRGAVVGHVGPTGRQRALPLATA